MKFEIPPPNSMTRNLLVAMMLGLVTYVALYELRDTLFFGSASSAAVDFVMRLQSDGAVAVPGPAMTVVKIDDEAFIAMGRPLATPRDRLATVLRRVYGARPKLIVLDIEVGWPDDPGREATLKGALADFAKDGRTAVLMVREPLASDSAVPYLRPTIYDETFQASRNLRWVSFDLLEDSDGVSRRLSAWMGLCRGATPALLPSVPLAASAALQPGGLQALAATLAPQAPACGPTAPAPPPARSQRILYRFSWNPDSALTAGDNPIAIVKASDLLAGSAAVSPELFRDRIVVIGSTADATRDDHLTPLGLMPGTMIMANAVRTTLGGGEIHESGFLLGLVMAFVMSLITFGLWMLCRRVFDLNIVLFRELLKIVLTLCWGAVAWVFLTHSASLAFAFPQYVVLSYLAYAEGLHHAF